MINSIRIDRNVPMEMRDGTILRADIHRPDDNGKHPVILTRTPYDKILRKDNTFMNPDISVSFRMSEADSLPTASTILASTST